MEEARDRELVVRVVCPHFSIITPLEHIAQYEKMIEQCGRVCYQSSHRITDDSYSRFIKMVIKNGHHSVLEHCSISVSMVGSRSFSHQLVRHRIAAYSQESQRFCNYSNDRFGSLCVIVPPSISNNVEKCISLKNLCDYDICLCDYDIDNIEFSFFNHDGDLLGVWENGNDPFSYWAMSIFTAYRSYQSLIDCGIPSEDAREVLPNSTKTEVVATFNLREWRHFFMMRCDSHAQWQIRSLALEILSKFNELMPNVFKDLYDKFFQEPE